MHTVHVKQHGIRHMGMTFNMCTKSYTCPRLSRRSMVNIFHEKLKGQQAARQEVRSERRIDTMSRRAIPRAAPRCAGHMVFQQNAQSMRTKAHAPLSA